jgi:hypothetical protein
MAATNPISPRDPATPVTAVLPMLEEVLGESIELVAWVSQPFVMKSASIAL